MLPLAGLPARSASAAIAAPALILALLSAPALAASPFRLGPSGEVVELLGLATKDDCSAGSLRGVVVRRVFDQSEMNMTGLVIEEQDGSRSHINIDTHLIEKMNMVDLSNVRRGLQTMLREGSKVELRVWLCGAAGRVMMLFGARRR